MKDPEDTPAKDYLAPVTTITSGPSARTKNRTATFEFSSSEPDSTFVCSFDHRPPKPCGSPYTKRVKPGAHSFDVWAIDAAGNKDSFGAYIDWTVKKPRRR